MERIRFSMTEIDNAKSVTGPLGMPVISYGTPVTPGVNMRMLFEKQIPLWVPRFDDYGPMPILVNPDYTAKMFGGRDMFGVEWERVAAGFGTMVRPGNPLVPDISRWEDYVVMPDPDSWDWDKNLEEIKKVADPERMTNVIFFTGFFERLISLMDLPGRQSRLLTKTKRKAFTGCLAGVVTFMRKYCFSIKTGRGRRHLPRRLGLSARRSFPTRSRNAAAVHKRIVGFVHGKECTLISTAAERLSRLSR